MSIELPETLILVEQMREILIGKELKSYHLQNYERMQKIGFFNKDLSIYEKLIGESIIDVSSKGSTLVIILSGELNIIIAPEYGGRIFYHENKASISDKYHVKFDFTDEAYLTIRIMSMGEVLISHTKDLNQSYIYKRDFLTGLSPVDDEQFIFKKFKEIMNSKNQMMKSVLVGKTAVIVGFHNATFQELLYKAKIHPKRKASSLNEQELNELYESIKSIISIRKKKGGKNSFYDLFGVKGKYKMLMGSHMKKEKCSECDSPISSMNIGGGVVHICPTCQK